MPNLFRRLFSNDPSAAPAPVVEPRRLEPFERLHHRARDRMGEALTANAQGRWTDAQNLFLQAMTLDLDAARKATDPTVRSSLTCSAAVMAWKGGRLSKAVELATKSLDGASRDTQSQALEMIELIAVAGGDPRPNLDHLRPKRTIPAKVR